MEHKIGTKIVLEVVDEGGESCTECFFNEICRGKGVNCLASEREDGRCVVYKEIKEDE